MKKTLCLMMAATMTPIMIASPLAMANTADNGTRHSANYSSVPSESQTSRTRFSSPGGDNPTRGTPTDSAPAQSPVKQPPNNDRTNPRGSDNGTTGDRTRSNNSGAQ